MSYEASTTKKPEEIIDRLEREYPEGFDTDTAVEAMGLVGELLEDTDQEVPRAEVYSMASAGNYNQVRDEVL